jgi:hypothetical protein
MTISSKFEHGTGYIWQPVEAPNLPETISVEGLTLLKKSEYHVSLAYVQHLLASEPEIEIKVFESLLAFNEKSEVSFLKSGSVPESHEGEIRHRPATAADACHYIYSSARGRHRP